MSRARKLPEAQLRALHKFAQAGGHGYGEYSFLPRPVARALERRGLVVLYHDGIPMGRATDAGRAMLAAADAATCCGNLRCGDAGEGCGRAEFAKKVV